VLFFINNKKSRTVNSAGGNWEGNSLKKNEDGDTAN
jgi:hypothetical protein